MFISESTVSTVLINVIRPTSWWTETKTLGRKVVRIPSSRQDCRSRGAPQPHSSSHSVENSFGNPRGVRDSQDICWGRDIWAALGDPAGAVVDADSTQRCFSQFYHTSVIKLWTFCTYSRYLWSNVLVSIGNCRHHHGEIISLRCPYVLTAELAKTWGSKRLEQKRKYSDSTFWWYV